MSSKTEILSFDDALSNHKSLLTESLVSFDEGQRVRKIMLDIDSNSADYEYYFQSGQQSKQAEIDELIGIIKTSAESEMYLFDELQKVKGDRDELQKRVKELEIINFDSELHFDAAKEHIDHLQKRIDDTLIELKEAYRKGIIEKPRCIIDSMNILKGNKDEK